MRLSSGRPQQSPTVFALAAVVITILFFVVRWSGAPDLVTNDEPFWLGRSANFSRAITYKDFDHTFQMAHPGVPVMWAGAIAFWLHEPGYTIRDLGNTEWPFFIDDRLAHIGIDPLTILNDARFVKLLLETAIFAIAIMMVATVGSPSHAVVTGILIAMDPFLVGFGPLLHVDSLFAISLFSATLAAIWAFEPNRSGRLESGRLLFAGALAAIAVLTRMTGIVIAVPLLVLSVEFLRPFSNASRHRISSLAVGVTTWCFSFLVISFAAWPALWISPGGTVKQVFSWTFGAASGGHEHALFFAGEVINSDPGFWFYPMTLLWRTTPLTWLGLALFLCSLKSRKCRILVHRLLPLIVLGAFFVIVMTAGAKKFDRYILPMYPVISLLASIGFCWVLAQARNNFAMVWRWLVPIGLVMFLTASFVPLLASGRYHLNYYNPVMRHLGTPEESIQIGWGEGGSEVIDYLNSESTRLGRPVIVQTFSIPKESIPPPLKYFLYEDGELSKQIQFRNVGLTTPFDWEQTDYFAFNIQQTQRGMVPEYEFFSELDPVHIVKIEGVTIWEIYAPSQSPVPESLR